MAASAPTSVVATEFSTTVDYQYGLPTLPPPRLSLNGNAKMAISPNLVQSTQSSKSNDAIYSITSTRASQHFNIDEYYVKSDSNKIMGKTYTKHIPHV